MAMVTIRDLCITTALDNTGLPKAPTSGVLPALATLCRGLYSLND